MKDFEIAESLNKDFNSVLDSREIQEFKKGLDFKSAKTRQTDEQAFNLILNRLRMYKDGWIMNNALQVQNLSSAADEIQQTAEYIFDFNKTLNNIIKILRDAGLIKQQTLEDLRELERQLNEMKL